jgi:L-amino acid N-acyltransferase YncA
VRRLRGTPVVLDFVIVDAESEHIADIARIYAHAVATSSATFEEDVPDEAEMRSRFDAIRAQGFPYLVALRDATVVGYAYASLYRTRSAYRFTCEDSVYVDTAIRRAGIGRALLDALVQRAAQCGFRQMIAAIGDSDNAASVALHRAAGFEAVGTFRKVGFKFERWLDVVLMQRALP